MCFAGRQHVLGSREKVAGVDANSLQEAIAGARIVSTLVDREQRLGHERLEEIHRVIIIKPRQGDSRGQVERADKDSAASEELLLVGIEQVVGPVEGGLKRSPLLAPLAAREHSETIRDPIENFSRREHRNAGGGDLNHERHAVELLTDLHDRGPHWIVRVVAAGERRVRGRRSPNKKSDRGFVTGETQRSHREPRSCHIRRCQ